MFATPQKLKQVSRAGHAKGTTIEHVRIDHGGLEIGVPQKLLDRANVLAPLQ